MRSSTGGLNPPNISLRISAAPGPEAAAIGAGLGAYRLFHFATRYDRKPGIGLVAALSAVCLFLGAAFVVSPASSQPTQEDCMICHADPDLAAEDGRPMGIDTDSLAAGVHGDFACVDCHVEPGNYDDLPHFDQYVPVDCSACHEETGRSYLNSLHGVALARGNSSAPACADCHGAGGDPHYIIKGPNIRTAGDACRHCHSTESVSYDRSVHAEAAYGGNDKPGCMSCHPAHGEGLPPSAGRVNSVCESCHRGATDELKRGDHEALGDALVEIMDCSTCHDVHETQKPDLSEKVSRSCIQCHEDQEGELVGSVHESMIAAGTMDCLSCHSAHRGEEEGDGLVVGCGACHPEIEEQYRESVHRLSRIRGDGNAAKCADCHEGHHVLAASDSTSPVSHGRIPNMCGSCHGDEAVVTSDFVRLPISLPSYMESVHGKGWKEGKKTAICTDCHGVHNLKTARDDDSSINRFRQARTCGKCHDVISNKYLASVHGRALSHGIIDAPTCTDCHDEHLIRPVHDPQARSYAEHRARQLCGDCHTDPELVSRYGIPAGVVETYLDSYHGWAVHRGSEVVATCTDCHNVHDIRSELDPASSIHKNNVTETCARCHEGANPTFAQSYSHQTALQARGYHGWARLIYIVLICVVLGGMVLHNLVIAQFELKRHLQRRRKVPYFLRWSSAERIQHLVLLTCFIVLALTGFALRYPHCWCARLLGLSQNEVVRANIHRGFAIALVGTAIIHITWLWMARRGRYALKALAPRLKDFRLMFQNLAYHSGRRSTRPAFGACDYTQKLEYWAVIWGTVVMAVTGFVLWFPTFFTSWLPAWVVRVAEVIHFYEAILAVSAIVIWHFFYVIFMPGDYPMSTVWLDGRMPAEEWKEHHRDQYEEFGKDAIREPSGPQRRKVDSKTNSATKNHK